MAFHSRMKAVLKALLHKERVEADLDSEIRSYIDALADEKVESGLSEAEARRQAVLESGGQEQIKQAVRDHRAGAIFESLAQDIRYGLRLFRRNPGFTFTIVLTLAIAVGMNTAMFSVIEAVLFRPLPYPGANRLVWLANGVKNDPTEHDNTISRADYSTWKEQTHSFERIGAYGNEDLAVLYKGQPSQERIASINGDLWELSGAHAELGNLFPDGQPHAMVITHELFVRRFHADLHVLGQSVTINGYPFTITGVLSKDFRFLFPEQYSPADESRPINAFIAFPPSVMHLPIASYTAWQPIVERLGPIPYYVYVVARLRPGVSLASARAEMTSIYARIVQHHTAYEGQSDAMHVWRMKMLKERLAGSARQSLVVLLAAVGFVLLIACANVANLLLAKATTRQGEIAVRTAMGAGRARVIRQFLVEAMLLALFGGIAGIMLANVSIKIMTHTWPGAAPRLAEAQLDIPVLLAAFALTGLTGVVFGLAPALLLSHFAPFERLKDNTQMSIGGRSRERTLEVLVTVELALAVVLLSGAGLMLKSFWRMNAAPEGFNPSSIQTLRVSLAGSQYNTWPAQQAYIHTLLSRLNALPGVGAAGIDSTVLHTNVKVDGTTPNTAFASIRAVSAGYVRAMGVPLLPQYGPGRWLNDHEMLDEVLVNESFAREFAHKGETLTGRHISGSFLSGTIAGVVADFKSSQLDADSMPEVYTSYELAPLWTPMELRIFARMQDDRKPDNRMFTKVVSAIDPTQPVYDVQTLEQALADSIAPRRFNLFLMDAFAGTALLMAVVGIYGVIAYSAAQRTREIGLRMAMGADRGSILSLVLSGGLRMVGIGMAVGVASALGLMRLMAGLLYKVGPGDADTFALVVAGFGTIALLACLGPSLRAAFVAPAVALHHE